MIAAAISSSVPITTRSGRMKSLIAAPSRRNSGLEATLNFTSLPAASSSRWISSRTRLEVPTGTVLFVTTTL